MATKEECDRYAAEAARRFDDFIRWAIINWPHKNFPLVSSDFADSRRELSAILGSKLHDGQSFPSSDRKGDDAQYIDMNPSPWP
ncbi:MAG: hypothetical protein HYS18_13715 [Burkholderiales bacterium]|nr:hypothetical protein [Burkholderiales bacterium]